MVRLIAAVVVDMSVELLEPIATIAARPVVILGMEVGVQAQRLREQELEDLFLDWLAGVTAVATDGPVLVMVAQVTVRQTIHVPALMQLGLAGLIFLSPTVVPNPPVLVRRGKATGHSPKCLLANGK